MVNPDDDALKARQADENRIVPDGFGVRVPIFMMDGVPVSDPARATIFRARPSVDARPAPLHRPGFVQISDAQRDQREAARDAYVERLVDTFKKPLQGERDDRGESTASDALLSRSAVLSGHSDEGDLSREAYLDRVRNAWRGPQKAAAIQRQEERWKWPGAIPGAS